MINHYAVTVYIALKVKDVKIIVNILMVSLIINLLKLYLI